MVEQRTVNPRVIVRFNYLPPRSVAQWLERAPDKSEVDGSNPSRLTSWEVAISSGKNPARGLEKLL